MLGLFRKKPSPDAGPTQVVSLWDGNIMLDLPAAWSIEPVEASENFVGGVLATTSDDPPLNLHVSVRLVPAKVYAQDGRAAQHHVEARAKEIRAQLRKNGFFVYFRDPGPPGKGDDNSSFHHWQLGMDQALIVCTGAWPNAGVNGERVSTFVSTVEHALSSARFAETISYKLEDQTAPEFAPLTPEHSEMLDADRRRVYDLARELTGQSQFLGGARDIVALQALYEHPKFDRQTEGIFQAMGVILGDHLARRTGMTWITFTDEHGTTPALCDAAKKNGLFPRDMLSRRIEKGETLNIPELAASLLEHVLRSHTEG